MLFIHIYLSSPSGEHISLDVIVYGTGFLLESYPLTVRGKGGKNLVEHFVEQGGPAAYRGCMIPGFPNFFMIPGPNSVSGHSSALFTIETLVSVVVAQISNRYQVS